VSLRFLFTRLNWLILSVLFIPAIASAYDVTLAWDSNTESDLEGYKLYSRIENSTPPYDNIDTYAEEELADPLDPMVTVTDLERDVTYYFAVTAYDTSGNESDYSNLIWVKNGQWGKVQTDSNDGVARSDASDSGGGGGGGACFIANAAGDFSALSLSALLNPLRCLFQRIKPGKVY
jgi:hypothetical protein